MYNNHVCCMLRPKVFWIRVFKMKAWFLKGNIYYLFPFPYTHTSISSYFHYHTLIHAYLHISIPIHSYITFPFPFTICSHVHLFIIHSYHYHSQSLFSVNQYIVRFNYSGACPNVIPGKTPPKTDSPVGWILIGMLVIFTQNNYIAKMDHYCHTHDT